MSTNQQQSQRSHLFTLRLWSEDLGDGRLEWRGKLHHVPTGEIRYFRDWPALIPLLLAMLRDSGAVISVMPGKIRLETDDAVEKEEEFNDTNNLNKEVKNE